MAPTEGNNPRRLVLAVTLLGLSQALGRSIGLALFYAQAGPARLPWVFILSDVLLGVAAVSLPRLLKRSSAGQSLEKVLKLSLPFLWAAMIWCGLAPGSASTLVFLVVHFVSSLLGLILFSQWLPTLFSLQTLKKEGGWLFLGLPMGALSGGLLVRILSHWITPNQLLLLLGLPASFVAVWVLSGMTRKMLPMQTTGRAAEVSAGQLLRRPFSPGLVLSLFIGAALFIFASRLLEFSAARVLKQAYPQQVQLTRFFAGYEIVANVAAMVLQGLVAARWITWLGVGGANAVFGLLHMGAALVLGMTVSPVGAALLLFVQGEGKTALRAPVQNLLVNGLPPREWRALRTLLNGVVIPAASLLAAGLLLWQGKHIDIQTLAKGAVVLLLMLLPVLWWQGRAFGQGVFRQVSQGGIFEEGRMVVRELPFAAAVRLIDRLLHHPLSAVRQRGMALAVDLGPQHFFASLMRFFEEGSHEDRTALMLALRDSDQPLPAPLRHFLSAVSMRLDEWALWLNVLGEKNESGAAELANRFLDNPSSALSVPARLLAGQAPGPQENLVPWVMSLSRWGSLAAAEAVFQSAQGQENPVVLAALALRLGRADFFLNQNLTGEALCALPHELQWRLIQLLPTSLEVPPPFFLAWLCGAPPSLKPAFEQWLKAVGHDFRLALFEQTGWDSAATWREREAVWPLLWDSEKVMEACLEGLGQCAGLKTFAADFSPVLHRCLLGEISHRRILALKVICQANHASEAWRELWEALGQPNGASRANAEEVLLEWLQAKPLVQALLSGADETGLTAEKILSSLGVLTLALLCREEGLPAKVKEQAWAALHKKAPEHVLTGEISALSVAG